MAAGRGKQPPVLLVRDGWPLAVGSKRRAAGRDEQPPGVGRGPRAGRISQGDLLGKEGQRRGWDGEWDSDGSKMARPLEEVFGATNLNLPNQIHLNRLLELLCFGLPRINLQLLLETGQRQNHTITS